MNSVTLEPIKSINIPNALPSAPDKLGNIMPQPPAKLENSKLQKSRVVHIEMDLAEASHINYNARVTPAEKREYTKFLRNTRKQMMEMGEKASKLEGADERSQQISRLRTTHLRRHSLTKSPINAIPALQNIDRVKPEELRNRLSTPKVDEKIKQLEKYQKYLNISKILSKVGFVLGAIGLIGTLLACGSPVLVPLIITVLSVVSIIGFISIILSSSAPYIYYYWPKAMVEGLFFSTGGAIALSVLGGAALIGGGLGLVGEFAAKHYQRKWMQTYMELNAELNNHLRKGT